MEAGKPLLTTKEFGEAILKTENESLPCDVVYYAKYLSPGTKEIKVTVPANYGTPLADSLLEAIKQSKKHPTRINFDLRVYLKSENRELLNPNCLSGWFDEKEIVYEFVDDVKSIEYRSYDPNPTKKWYSFYINQNKGMGKANCLKFSYPGLIRVDGSEEETLKQAIENDGRFINDVFRSKLFRDKKNNDYPPNIAMKYIKDKTLIVCHTTSPQNTTRVISKTSLDDCQNTADDIKTKLDLNTSATYNANNSSSICDDSTAGENMKKTYINLKLPDFDGSFKSLVEAISKNTGLDWECLFKEKTKRKGAEYNKKDGEISAFMQPYSSAKDDSYDFALHKKLADHGDMVCYIEYPAEQGKRAQGTGFVVGIEHCIPESRDYVVIMTCYHVFEVFEKKIKDEAQQCVVTFDYHTQQSVAFVQSQKPTVFKILDVLAQDKSLDYALLILEYSEDLLRLFPGRVGLGSFITRNVPLNKEVLRLIGHPEWKQKKVDSLIVISDQLSEVVFAMMEFPNLNKSEMDISEISNPERMFYHCSSFHGASGSPCFDSLGNLVCMHRAGYWFSLKHKNYLNKKSVLEIGVPLWFIVRDLYERVKRNQCPQLTMESLCSMFPVLKKEMCPA